MPLSPKQEELCRRLEMGRPEPSAAALIRQQARDIDELWDRYVAGGLGIVGLGFMALGFFNPDFLHSLHLI